MAIVAKKTKTPPKIGVYEDPRTKHTVAAHSVAIAAACVGNGWKYIGEIKAEAEEPPVTTDDPNAAAAEADTLLQDAKKAAQQITEDAKQTAADEAKELKEAAAADAKSEADKILADAKAEVEAIKEAAEADTLGKLSHDELLEVAKTEKVKFAAESPDEQVVAAILAARKAKKGTK